MLSFNRLERRSTMRGNINSRMDKLRLRAIRKNGIARRLLKRIDRELSKKKSDLPRVLLWQTRTTKLLNQALKYVKKRENLKRSRRSETEPEAIKPINFNLEKVSERFVMKFGATSCVFRAKMQSSENLGAVKVKDITGELNSVFNNAIEQVICDEILSHSN